MKILFALVCLSLTSVAAQGQSLSEPPTAQPPTVPAFACDGSGFGESWAYDGPYDQMLSGEPFLGQITAVQMKPGNSQIIFASGNTSGMFKSIDGGLNWYSVTDQLQVPGLGITDIAFRQDDPNVMFATTGEMSNQYGNYSLGLIGSGDEGETWQYIMNLGEQVSFSNAFHDNVLSCITINPLDDNELIVGGFKKIYQSMDGGDSWTFFDFDETIDNTGNFYISDVEFDPTNNDIVFVSTKSGVNDLWVNLWVSEDHGDTWQIRNPPTTPNEVIRLDLTDAEPTFTYCAVLDAQSKLDIYKTDDAGITWLLIVENLSANVGSSMGYYKCEFKISNLTTSIIYLGSYHMYMAFYNGTQWSGAQLIDDGMHPDIRDVHTYSFASGMESILVGSDGGVQIAEINVQDILNGATFPSWGELNGEGLQLTQIYGLGEFERGANGIYGAQDIGTWRIDQSGSTHELGGDGSFTSCNDYFNSVAVAANQYNASYSKDAGNNFIGLISTYDSPFGSPSNKNLRLRHFFNSKDQRELCFPGFDFATWNLNTNLDYGPVQATTIQIPAPNGANEYQVSTAFAYAPSDNNIRYMAFVGTYWSGVNDILNPTSGIPDPALVANGQLINRLLKSTDGGATFSVDLSNSLSYTNNLNVERYVYEYSGISYLIVDPFDANHIYAALGGFSDYANSDRVIVSDDGGASWTDMSEGLSQFPINQLIYQDGSDEVLYAATDAGVYRWNKALQEWQCFNNGLPPCIVTSMDIDPCENSMVIATYGRGIWKINLPAIENDVVYADDYTIEPYEVHSYQNNIVVNAGVTLTIQGHVYLKPHKAIVVKVGGHLILDGGLVSNSCIGTLGQGIVVEGDINAHQLPEINQGYCEMKNGAVIENMHTGILLAGLALDVNGECITDVSKAGGIIKATDSHFLNCYVGVEFFPYSSFSSTPQHWPLSNHSFFKNSDFETTRVLDMSSLGFVPAPKAGIILKGVLKIKIEGCRFGNSVTGDSFFDSQYKLGKGIWCINSSCKVKDYCSTTSCPTPIHNSFTNLEYGVLSQSSDFVSSFEIRNADFTSNFCGVRSEGSLVGPIIRGNNFYVEDMDVNSDGEEPIGINLDATSGFHLQENHFYTSINGEGPPTIGVAIENTTMFGTDPLDIQEAATNIIYRNWFEGLDIACNVEGQNAVEDPNNVGESYGLEFRCNKFGQINDDCEKDFNLYTGTSVQKHQGSLFQDNAAGNLFFDDDCDFEYEHWNAGLFSTELTAYYYNPNTNQYICEPNCSDLSVTNPIPANGLYDEQNTCPVHNIDPTWKPQHIIHGEHAAKKSALLSTQDVFHGILDGGDLNNLKNLIENPLTESAAIRNELLEFTPNISDMIWQKCFDRQPAINPWHLTQVLLSALPLRSSVLEMMKYSDFPQEFKDMVTNGQFNGLSEKEIFESDLAGIAQDAGELRQDFLRCFLLLDEDTNTGGNALLEDFLTENETAPDYYILAGLRLLNKNTTGASEALSNCSTISPTKDILRPFCIMLESIQLGQYPLLNQSHIDELEDLVYDENVIGCAQARALLSMVQEIDFPMEIETEVVHSRSLRQEKNDPAIASFTIQPTPANNTLWLAYPYLPGMKKVTVSIVDIMGKVMIRSDLSRINGLYELNTANWPTGFYLVEVFIDELTMGVQKCEIQH